jgi:hypothetical protein
MVDPGDRARWQPSLLDDPRVQHFWDEEKVVGRWFASHHEVIGVEFEGETLWDVFLVFPREERWEDLPQPLLSWGRPILYERKALRRGLLGAAKRP